MEAGIKFVVGSEYYYRFTCDWDTICTMVVVSRTDKTITIQERGEKTRRYKIHNWSNVERLRSGNYSGAGIWSADRPGNGYKEAVEPVTTVPEPVEAPAPEAPSNLIPFPSKAPVAAPETAPIVPELSHAEVVPMVALGRKILTEALSILGRQTEIDLIEAILDRDHWKMLETLRGAIATGKVG